MSTTLDARLAALKVGDKVRWQGGWGDCEGTFQLYHGDRVCVINNGTMVLICARDIRFPPPPKAEPWKVYQHKEMGAAIGLVSGQLRTVCPTLAGGGHSVIVNVPMSADWIEVPDEQEGR